MGVTLKCCIELNCQLPCGSSLWLTKAALGVDRGKQALTNLRDKGRRVTRHVNPRPLIHVLAGRVHSGDGEQLFISEPGEYLAPISFGEVKKGMIVDLAMLGNVL